VLIGSVVVSSTVRLKADTTSTAVRLKADTTSTAVRLKADTTSVAGGAQGQAQSPASDATSQVVGERMRALQREAAQLAGQTKTLLGELRTLEIARELRRAEAGEADRALAQSRAALAQTSERLDSLERQRVAQLPNLKAQLVDVYKNGRSGYARVLFDVDGLRDFARATRAVTAIAAINERRIDEHRRTVEALTRERVALEQTSRDLQARDAGARRARSAAERAVAAHAALIEQIDTRRDLTAQFAGELQVAYERLEQQLTSAGGPERGVASPSFVVAPPPAPFKGALAWPAQGQVRARFGVADGRLGGTAVRNGMEIAAPEGTAVRAVHAGTVSFADAFTGFGTLVIVDHGADSLSLYGYLGALSVTRGSVVESGAELGKVGLSPAGPPALYFEMRVDGRAVDPLQWLQAR
jgi:septal ring factor EnvC (AmiA/AmiB activator)